MQAYRGNINLAPPILNVGTGWSAVPFTVVLLSAEKLSTQRIGCLVRPSAHLNLKHNSARIFLCPLSSYRVQLSLLHPQFGNPHSAADNFTLVTKGI